MNKHENEQVCRMIIYINVIPHAMLNNRANYFDNEQFFVSLQSYKILAGSDGILLSKTN